MKFCKIDVAASWVCETFQPQDIFGISLLQLPETSFTVWSWSEGHPRPSYLLNNLVCNRLILARRIEPILFGNGRWLLGQTPTQFLQV